MCFKTIKMSQKAVEMSVFFNNLECENSERNKKTISGILKIKVCILLYSKSKNFFRNFQN